MRKFLNSIAEWENRYLTVPVILGIAVLLGLLLTLCHCIFLFDVYRDVGNCYATFTRIFAEGGFLEGLNPSLPVMQIAVAGTVSFVTGFEPLRVLIFTGGIFYLLTAFPLYFLQKHFVSPRLAAWGVLAYILAPKVIRFSLTALPEPARNFFLVTAVLAVLLLFDRPTIWKTFLLGAALAGFTLSRSEGIAVSCMILVALAICLFLQTMKSDAWKAAKNALLYPFFAFVFFLLLLTPRLYTNSLQTGYPTPDARLNRYIHRYLTPSVPLRDFSSTPTRHTDLSTVVHRREIPAGKRLSRQLTQFIRGSYEIYLALAVAGLFAGLSASGIRRRFLHDWKPATDLRKHRLEYSFLATVILMHAIVYWPVNPAYRYYTFCVPLLMPLTMTGVDFCWAVLRKYRLEQLLVPAFLILSAAQIHNGFDSILNQEKRHRQAGQWIAERFTPADRKLRILNYNGYVIYWVNGKIVNPYYEGPPLLPEYASEFDVAILEPDDTGRIEILRSRADVTEVETPYGDVMTVFRQVAP